MDSISSKAPLVIGRYAIYDQIAAGGMGTVHLARLMGPAGFSRTVAIKRLHPQLTSDDEFAAMLKDEARVAARIRHPNVVSTLDVVAVEDQLLLVMDYIHGESVLRLARTVQARGELIPLRIVGAILIDALHGLHAAHEATDQQGRPLGVVHRDISPQNLLVSVEGVTRVADFGIAKAAGQSHVTGAYSIKGKIAYMAPEQLEQGEVSRGTDLFAASIVLWELLTGRTLFAAKTDGQTIHNVLKSKVVPPSHLVPGLPPELDAIVRRGLSRDPKERYSTAHEMAAELEACIEHVRPSEIGRWVQEVAREALAARAKLIRDIERSDPIAVVGAPEGSVSSLGQGASADAPNGAGVARTRRVDRPKMTSAPPPPIPLPPQANLESEPRYETSRINAIHVLNGELALPKRRRWAAVWVGIVALAGAAAVVLSGQRRPAFEPVAPSAQARPVASPELVPAKGESVEPAHQPVEAGVAASLDEAPAAPESSAKTMRHISAVGPKVSGSMPSRPAVAPTSFKPAVLCDPPYTVDSAGRRIFKIECM